ncbi:MAG: TonB-dependent receptor [Chromatiales bacterium]|nr:TonB-dependent receptor [Chromatiales bacterium]
MRFEICVPALAGLVILSGAGGAAVAQVQESADDEIIVTARKREETLRDVPISIATLTSEQLQGRGLNSDYDIANFTVGFRTLAQTGRDIDRPTIRGMSAPASRGEANASYFIDGTFVSGSISTATTSAVERVEVLRGPQSAQFGRATFSGAVNYVTRKPTETLQGQVNTRAGTSDDYNLGGWASGPLIEDQLFFVVSGNWSKYGGQWNNQLEQGQASYEKDTTLPFRQFLLDPPQDADHSRLGAEETTDALAKLVWRPAEGAEVSLKYGYTKGEDTHFASLIAPELNCYLPVPGTEDEPWYATSTGWYCGEFRAEGKVNRINLPDFKQGVTFIRANEFPNPADYTVPPTEPGTFREQHRVLLEYVQDVSGFTVTSRGSWSSDDFQQVFDLDHTENRSVWGLFHFDNQRDIEDYSAELRLDTPGDLPVRGALGVYWYDQDRENRQRSFVGPGVVFGAPDVTTAFPPSNFIDVSNQAVYGSIEWDVAERWTLTLEGRYAEDSKDLSGGALTGPDLPASVGLDFDSFTPRATVRFKPAEYLTLYVLAAKGNKPGDFNVEFFRSGIDSSAVRAGLDGCVPPPEPQRPVVIPCLPEPLAIVKEEEQWTYELGAKATWLDGRLSTNLALYHIDWKNQGLFTRAGILQTSGTYLETTILRNAGESKVDGLELETSLRVTDNFSVTANYGYTDSRYTEGTDSILAELTGDGNISGKKAPNVPEHTLILGGFVTAPLSPGAEAFVNVDYAYSTKRYTQANNFSWLGDDLTVNLRAGVQTDSWTVTAYVRNLTDDDTPLASLDFVNFGTVDVNYDVNFYGNIPANAGPNDDRDPRIFSLSPKRGRDWGLEVQYRF